MPNMKIIALEGQEQDLEIDMAIDAVGERNAQAGDSLADTPFSPIASRAFSTAVDDTNTLSKMNDVLENIDIEDISESSRQVIQTAMESIRARLLGGSSAKSVAVEGFSNKNDLKIAIEDNKNILQRAWDAIVKFFKGIYEWIAGLFKKKQSDAKVLEADLSAKENALKALEKLDLKDANTTEEIHSAIESVAKAHGVTVKLPDGTILGKTNTANENGTDYNKLIATFGNIMLGKEPLVLVTNHYNPLLGSQNIELTSKWKEEVKKLSDSAENLMSSLDGSGLGGIYETKITKESISKISDKSLEEIIGSELKISPGTSIEISGNNVSVKKAEDNEIEIAVYETPSNARKINGLLIEQLREHAAVNKEIYEMSSKLTNRIHDFGKELSADTEESDDSIKLLRSKMQLINSVIKFSILGMNQGMKAIRLNSELLDSYIAGVSMLISQAKKAQAK